MTLTLSLEQIKQNFSGDKLEALILWFVETHDTIEARSRELEEIYEAAHKDNVENVYNALAQLSTRDLVEFCLINEFGHNTLSQGSFQALTQAVIKRLSQ